MGRAHVEVVERFAAPPERLWEALNDHAGMSDWLGLDVTVVRGDGEIGTVRRMRQGSLAFDEEVVYLDPPRRLVYRVVGLRPMLRYHRGEQLIEPWGQTGSELRWHILLDTSVPGLSTLLARVLESGIRKGLGVLRARLAEEGRSVAAPRPTVDA